MDSILNSVLQPWPWYVSGPLIGLTVPLLLLLGNKAFGISANLRHICAAILPGKVSYFKYNWKVESWNLLFAGGIIAGGWFAVSWLTASQPIEVSPALLNELSTYDLEKPKALYPVEIFNTSALGTLRGVLLVIVGGFMVGFGTRYAGGCTSGHAIYGLSNLQWPSLIATICFMIGGFVGANILLPFILSF